MKKILLMCSGFVVLIIIIVLAAFFTSAPPVQAKSNSSLGRNSATATDPYCQAYQKDLANRLHVSVQTLQQAQQAALKDTLNQMVKDGKLTQKQANAIEQRHQSHMNCTYQNTSAIGHAVTQQFVATYHTYVLDVLAPKLHLTSQQLNSELQSGKSLSQIAAAQNISEAQLKTIANDSIRQALDKAVKDGNLTQSQANSLAQYAQSNPNFVNYIVNAQIPQKKAA